MVRCSTPPTTNRPARSCSRPRDIDNDGDWDLYVTNVWLPYPPPRGNPLYLGDGAGGLTDNACDRVGVCAGHQSWPTSFADFDRDGWVDLFVPEAIAARATFDPADGVLEVRATSTLRGRSQLAVAGLGAVPWRAAELEYRQSWIVPADPGTIEVQTASGGAVVVQTEPR